MNSNIDFCKSPIGKLRAGQFKNCADRTEKLTSLWQILALSELYDFDDFAQNF